MHMIMIKLLLERPRYYSKMNKIIHLTIPDVRIIRLANINGRYTACRHSFVWFQVNMAAFSVINHTCKATKSSLKLHEAQNRPQLIVITITRFYLIGVIIENLHISVPITQLKL